MYRQIQLLSRLEFLANLALLSARLLSIFIIRRGGKKEVERSNTDFAKRVRACSTAAAIFNNP